MLVAVLLQRKTFMVFGAIGVYSYLGHLAFDVFKNSLLFPAALTALGIAIIAAGVWYRSREAARSEEHTSELQSQSNLVCRLLLEKKKKQDLSHALDHNHIPAKL